MSSDAATESGHTGEAVGLGLRHLGISLTANTVLTCVLTLTGFAYLAAQKLVAAALLWGVLCAAGSAFVLDSFSWVTYGCVLGILRTDVLEFVPGVYRRLGSDPPHRLEKLPPSSLGSHAELRHTGAAGHVSLFPTMKVESYWRGRSMRNRGAAPAQPLCHPAASCEYVAVPLLLRCLQIADQLSVSAVARGARSAELERPVITEKTLMLQTGPGLPAGQSIRRHFSGWEVCEYDASLNVSFQYADCEEGVSISI